MKEMLKSKTTIILFVLLGYLLLCVYMFTTGISLQDYQQSQTIILYYFFKVSFWVGYYLCMPALPNFGFFADVSHKARLTILGITGTVVSFVIVFFLYYLNFVLMKKDGKKH